MNLTIQVTPKRVLQELREVLTDERSWRHGLTQELTAFDEPLQEKTLLEALRRAVGRARDNLDRILRSEELPPVDDLRSDHDTLFKEAGIVLASAVLQYCGIGLWERFKIRKTGLLSWSDAVDHFNSLPETTHRDVVVVINSALHSLEGKKFVTKEKMSNPLPRGIVQA
jgi:hypothetical protein